MNTDEVLMRALRAFCLQEIGNDSLLDGCTPADALANVLEYILSIDEDGAVLDMTATIARLHACLVEESMR